MREQKETALGEDSSNRISPLLPHHSFALLCRLLFSFLSLVGLFSILSSQTQQFRFNRITVENGLSSNVIRCIVQDRFGFIWIGTIDGLNRYDGVSVKVYRSEKDDSTSLRGNEIEAIVEGRDGNLWVAAGGLHQYDHETDSFIRYRVDSTGTRGPRSTPYFLASDTKAGYLWIAGVRTVDVYDHHANTFQSIDVKPSPLAIKSISADQRGALWVCTYNYGPVRIQGSDRTVQIFSLKLPKDHPIRKTATESIFVEEDGTVFAASQDYLYHFDWNNSTISRRPEDLTRQFLGAVITKDGEGKYWIGSRSNGARVAARWDGPWTSVVHNSSDPKSLSSNDVNVIYSDRSGNVWIGTSNGVSLLPRRRKQFAQYSGATGNRNGPPVGEITAIAEDGAGDLWIGVYGREMTRFNPETGEFSKYPISRRNPSVRLMFRDDDGEIVLSSTTRRKYNRRSNQLIPYEGFDLLPSEETSDGYPPGAFLKDSQGTKWFGYRGGIIRFHRDGSRDTIVNGRKGLASFININRIYEDRTGTIWINNGGTGLYRYDRGRDFFHLTSLRQSYYDLLEDSDGGFWSGSRTGLRKYDRVGDSVLVHLDRSTGLGGTRVYGILEDDKKNIWVSTNAGVARVNIRTLEIRTYGPSDGVPPPALREVGHYGNAQHLKTSRGKFVFGLGSNGFVMFHPDSINDNPDPPPVYITGFSLAHAPVRPRRGSVLARNTILADTIHLAYHQNDLSIEFAALDYTAPEKNRYRYRLEGFEDDWIDAGTRNVAHYTNIDPGEYHFHVLGSNSDGAWNAKGATVLVVIDSPWWKTTFAYAAYVFIGIAFLYVARRFELNRQKHKNLAAIEHIKAEKLREVDQLKSRFFANISHEFRTPLNLIDGPARQLAAGMVEDVRETGRMISRNSQRLLRLVNQLLDISKIESGQMRLHIAQGDIGETVRGVAASFESTAARRGIEFSVETPEQPIYGWFDGDAIEKILANLLSNAFKFTESGGEVSIRVHRNDAPMYGVDVTVSDTGIGIAPGQIGKIFDRFYQVDDSYTRAQEGTGIGLAFAKELVDLHQGRITVESEPGKMSVFTVFLPLGREDYHADDIVEHDARSTRALAVQDATEAEESADGENAEPDQNHDVPLILVVEDNADMRRYIRSHLARDYRVDESLDGGSGLKRAFETIPDLIISDVMMPKMDGFELCRRLKTDERTSHVPVILLTAKAADGHKLEGLETGADEYLIKPFDAQELLVRLRNLIEQRRRLRQAFQRELVVRPSGIVVSSADERFLKKVFEVVEQHLSDPDLDPFVLAESVAMSRSQLHRKLRALTGYSTMDLVRHFRLQRAAELLRKKVGRVSEIAYEVGFNNLSYFAKQFHKKYGVNPSEYPS